MMANHTSAPGLAPAAGGTLPEGLSVVIPSWNGRALLEKFLPSVVEAAAAFEAACRAPTEVLIADDASSDATLTWLVACFPQVRFEASENRQGFAPTANRGVRAARYRLVYLVNNDVALEPASLPPLAPHFEDPRVFAVASQVYDYATGVLSGAGQVGEFRRGFLAIHRRYFVPAPPTAGAAHFAAPWLTLYASGGSSLFDREKFLALGGFDELFAPFGWEDVELSLRAWKRGYQVHYEPRSAVWHQFASTIAPRPETSRQRRRVNAIYERNRLLAHWLHLDTTTHLATHGFFLLLKLFVSPFSGRWSRFAGWSAAAQAAKRWGEVRARRGPLHAAQQRELRDVLAQLAHQLRRPEAQPLTPRTAPVRPHPGVLG
ncbi:MAG: glycosyltransferase [Planctomycetota bacterium]